MASLYPSDKKLAGTAERRSVGQRMPRPARSARDGGMQLRPEARTQGGDGRARGQRPDLDARGPRAPRMVTIRRPGQEPLAEQEKRSAGLARQGQESAIGQIVDRRQSG